EGGVAYVYFGNPFPLTRVRATAEAFLRLEEYETFTCLPDGARLDRDDQGRLRFAWRKGTPALGPSAEAKLISAGKLKAQEARCQLWDRDTAARVLAHAGSVSWNAYRRRWVMLTVQSAGTSFLGEVWYAEAD